MQVGLLLLILLSDSFAFGLRASWGYPTDLAVAWVLGSLLLMSLPYFRKPKWTDDSKWLSSGQDLWS